MLREAIFWVPQERPRVPVLLGPGANFTSSDVSVGSSVIRSWFRRADSTANHPQQGLAWEVFSE